jgi:hypothetical protein
MNTESKQVLEIAENNPDIFVVKKMPVLKVYRITFVKGYKYDGKLDCKGWQIYNVLKNKFAESLNISPNEFRKMHYEDSAVRQWNRAFIQVYSNYCEIPF